MSNYMIVAFIVLGVVGGYVSGLVGVGGGIILVPALVYLFKFDQHTAQGTTLALLIPPIGILGAMAYYQKGFVDVKVAGLICVGFVVGSWLGGKTAVALPDNAMGKVFGIILILAGLKMVWGK